MEVSALAGHKRSGDPVYERLLVDDLGGGRYRLLATPGLVLGVAAGDTIELAADRKPIVRARGGNLAVQIHGSVEIANELIPKLSSLDGKLDAAAKGLTVFTVPFGAGFSRLEEMLNAFVENHPEMEWYYGNVYDEDGVTPLNWWES